MNSGRGRWERRRRGPLAGRMRESVLSDRMADTGYFHRPTIGRLVDEHLGGRHDHSTVLWTLVMFDAFLRQSAALEPA